MEASHKIILASVVVASTGVLLYRYSTGQTGVWAHFVWVPGELLQLSISFVLYDKEALVEVLRHLLPWTTSTMPEEPGQDIDIRPKGTRCLDVAQ